MNTNSKNMVGVKPVHEQQLIKTFYFWNVELVMHSAGAYKL